MADVKHQLMTECPACGKLNFIEVPEDDYRKWKAGMHTQYAFPYLSAVKREMLISGYCEECQEHIFGPAEE